MKKSLLAILLTTLFAVAFSASDAEAGRFFRSSHRASSSSYTSSWQTNHYPRARQMDGRSHWDLGKQNGEWPTF